MKKAIASLLVLVMLALCPAGFAANWSLPEGTPMFEPGCVMELDFGTLTVLDAGFAKKAEMFFSVNKFTRTVNGVTESREDHGPIYYTAQDGFTLFTVKGHLHNTSGAALNIEELAPALRGGVSEDIRMTVYSVVQIGVPEQKVLEPDTAVDVCLACPVPGALYFGSGDLLVEFAGASLGFEKSELKSYASMGFSELSQPVEDVTQLVNESPIGWLNGRANEEGVLVANQSHVDEVRAEDVSLEYNSKKDQYQVHVKLRNLTGYPLIHDKLPNGVGSRLQFLDFNGDVLPDGDIKVGTTSSYSDLSAGQAGWDNSYTYVTKETIDKAVSIRISSYSFWYSTINSDGSSQSVDGTFTEPFVIALSDILPERKANAGNAESPAADRFTLRGGIMFGDSSQTVQEKEVFSLDKTSSSTLAGKGNIAGYDNSYVSYWFDDSNKLTEIVYMFEDTKDQNASRERYETVYAGLAKKYGESLDVADGEFYPLTTSAFDFYNDAAVIVSYTGRIAELERYDEWLVPDGDGSVKIDLVSTCYGSADSLNYILHLAYKHFETDDGQTSQIRSDNDL